MLDGINLRLRAPKVCVDLRRASVEGREIDFMAQCRLGSQKMESMGSMRLYVSG